MRKFARQDSAFSFFFLLCFFQFSSWLGVRCYLWLLLVFSPSKSAYQPCTHAHEQSLLDVIVCVRLFFFTCPLFFFLSNIYFLLFPHYSTIFTKKNTERRSKGKTTAQCWERGGSATSSTVEQQWTRRAFSPPSGPTGSLFTPTKEVVRERRDVSSSCSSLLFPTEPTFLFPHTPRHSCISSVIPDARTPKARGRGAGGRSEKPTWKRKKEKEK